LQYEKHDSHKTSTDDGIIIDFNPLERNADSSMRCNLESASNITDSTVDELPGRAPDFEHSTDLMM
jgi:hypothetical protein